MRSKARTDAVRASTVFGLCALWLSALISSFWLFGCPVAPAQSSAKGSLNTDVHISVLGLFHPTLLKVSATVARGLVVRAGDESIALERSSGVSSMWVSLSGSEALVKAGTRVIRSSELTVSGRDGGSVDLVLSVPNKITRCYHGRLQIRPTDGHLLAVVIMSLETAVASVVAAETAPDTPPEALKALAVAATGISIFAIRPTASFFANRRHLTAMYPKRSKPLAVWCSPTILSHWPPCTPVVVVGELTRLLK